MSITILYVICVILFILNIFNCFKYIGWFECCIHMMNSLEELDKDATVKDDNGEEFGLDDMYYAIKYYWLKIYILTILVAYCLFRLTH